MAAPVGPGSIPTPTISGPTTTSSPPPTTSSSPPTTASSSPPTTSSSSPSTNTSTSSSNTTTTSSSSTSNTSTTSSTPTTTSTPSSPTTAKTTTPTVGPVTTGAGGVVTHYTTATVSSTGGIAPSNTAVANTGKSFFQNTGAVAGTFSVVGLVVLAILIALITNGIRRRRARKFDQELAAATLEAASAPKPIFLDDDDDVGGGYGARGGYGAGGMGGGGGAGEYSDYTSGGGFSDVSSHGTYGQPPMSVSGHGQEAYGMRELGHGVGGVGPGEIFDPYSVAGVGAAAGAAGIGVARARSQKAQVEGAGPGGYGAGLQEGGAPYAAFAAPQGGGYDPYANNGSSYQRNADILEAAGMGAHVAGAAALARNHSANYASSTQYQGQGQQYGQQQLHHRTSPSQEYANLGRSKSSGGMGAVPEYDASPYADPNNGGHMPAPPVSATSGTSGATQYFSPVAESYASHYQAQGQAPAQPQALAQAYHQPQPQQDQGHQRGYSAASGSGEDMDDAYGGYVADMHVGYEAPAAGGAAGKRQSGVPNPFATSEAGYVQQGSGSDADSKYSDDEVEEEPRRVLKVANE